MKKNDYDKLFHWHSFRLKLVFEGIVVGIVTGVVIVLYRYLLSRAEIMIDNVYKILKAKPMLTVPWILALIAVGYIVGRIIKHEPIINGSGIPQVEAVLFRNVNMVWWRVLIAKFVGGVLSIGAGLSLGREGPSIQLGAAIGQGISKILKRVKIEEKYLITSGASAGLAAAFNAPLAGAMFSFEEVHKNFSPLVLLSALSAALSADFISSDFFGLKPMIVMKSLKTIPLNLYLYIILLGIIVGVSGVLFNKVLLKTQDWYTKQKWLPKDLRILLPLLISVIIGFLLPQGLGGGNGLINSMFVSKSAITILVALLIVRFFFTMICYGSGAPGGIFLPMLALGALIGNIYGGILVHFLHFDSIYMNNFIIIAMAGYFAAVVRAPITGTILITEMTGSFNHLLSLAVASIIAYVVADVLASEPIYESLLGRFLHNKENSQDDSGNNDKDILEFFVPIGSELDGKRIKEIEWPSECLLIAVKRGENEIIPIGDTLILAGDYLVILTDENKVAEVRHSVSIMTESCSAG